MNHFHSGDSTIASNCPKVIQDNNVTLRRKATDSMTIVMWKSWFAHTITCAFMTTVSQTVKKPICTVEFFLNTSREMIGRYSWSVWVNTHEWLHRKIVFSAFSKVAYSLQDVCITPRGVLPYVGYIGMCRCEGYAGFQAVYSRIGYINQSVWV